MMARARRDNTWVSYGGKVQRFLNFCAEYGFTPLPASQRTVLCYLAFLSDEDEVHARSLQPYLTAINQLHGDFHFDKPAIGTTITRARHGFEQLETETRGCHAQDHYLPASVVLRILDAGLATADLHLMRDTALVCLAYQFFARGDTGVRTTRAALRIDERGLHFAEAAKNVPRFKPYILTLPWPPQNRARSVHRLLRRFDTAANAAWLASGQHRPPQFFRLPTDRVALIIETGVREPVLPVTVMDTALANALRHVGASPGPGVRWTKKSIRSGGATSALAVNAPLPRIMRWGIWKSLAAVECYLDPLAPADEAAKFFFSHLLHAALDVTASTL